MTTLDQEEILSQDLDSAYDRLYESFSPEQLEALDQLQQRARIAVRKKLDSMVELSPEKIEEILKEMP